MHDKFLNRAIELAREGMEKGGGPFGAVIVKDDKILAESYNRVTLRNDPTAHAEVEAIRKAGEAIGDYNLEGCTIYASCEPCPMCLGAIYWAHISKIVYAADRSDAKNAGFDDEMIYKELSKPVSDRKIEMQQKNPEKVRKLFRDWNEQIDKQPY